MRYTGSLTASEAGEATSYGLYNAQDRGALFIGVQTPVYEGMIVGQCPKMEDIAVNVCKKKHLTAIRSTGADEALRLVTPKIMSLEEAVDLVLFAFEHGENGDLLIKKAPACTIQTQAEAVCELFGGNKDDIKVIGIRHGEKMYETLLTNEECAKAVDMGDFYRVPADNRGLNYDKYFKEGDEGRNTLTEFNSNNTRRLNLRETIDTIASLDYIKERLAED